MNTISDFDRRATAWLADGPSELSDRVLDAALREIHLTHQRRRPTVPWRTSMTSLRLVPAAGIALVVIAIGGAFYIGRGPSPTPSTTVVPTSTAAPTPAAEATQLQGPALATMPPLSAVFVSPWYGYRVSYPAGWQTTPGQGPWPIGATLLHLDPRLDEIRGPVGTHVARIVGASVTLPKGMGLDGFMAFASSGTCTSVEPLKEPVLVDGIEATVTLNGCASLSELNGLIWDVVLVTGGRGYDFTIDGFITSSEAQAWLGSISLDPGTALDASPGP